jgi:hypothetical protein
MLARDGVEAVEIFALTQGLIDLVTRDILCPGRAPRSLRAHPPFRRTFRYICTGYARKTAGPHYLEESGAELLQKPYSVDMLGRRFDRCWTRTPKLAGDRRLGSRSSAT